MENNALAELYFCGVCRKCYAAEHIASIFGAPKGDIPDYLCQDCARFPIPWDWKDRSARGVVVPSSFRGLGQAGGFSLGDSGSSSGGFGASTQLGAAAILPDKGKKRDFGEAFQIKPPSIPDDRFNVPVPK